ncbi:MAG: methyltransferase C-terminal domain-containing protein, partial [Patescibacteria group bacterium]
EDLRKYETELGLNNRKIYDDFVMRVEEIKRKISNFIKEEAEKGKKIYVYGASTKGNTLLQYFNLDNTLITAAAERNPAKWGKKTVGTNIPIISEEQARKEKPDYFLILPWHFIKEFKERETEYIKSGGKFIVPLPEFEIIDKI